GDPMRLQAPERASLEPDRARPARRVPGDHGDERGLPRSVRPDHGHALTLAALEADVAERSPRPVALGHVLELEQAHRATPMNSRARAGSARSCLPGPDETIRPCRST